MPSLRRVTSDVTTLYVTYNGVQRHFQFESLQTSGAHLTEHHPLYLRLEDRQAKVQQRTSYHVIG